MNNPTHAGRLIGGLLLAQITVGLGINFVVLGPVFAEPGFLTNAAAYPLHISVAAVSVFLSGALTLLFAITMWPLARSRSPSTALWLMALSLIGVTLGVIESATVLSMRSLSQAYVAATTANEELYGALRALVAAGKNWTHYLHMMIGGCTALVFYMLVFRLSLAPRMLGGFGMVAALSQLSTVAMPLFGGDVIYPMLLPLAISHLIMALWLLAKGFAPAPDEHSHRHES